MFIIVLVLTVISCRKPTTYNMPQDLKDYCMFPVGSWWVYEDSISGEKDSIVLMEQNIYFPYSNNKTYYFESLDEKFYFSNTNSINGSLCEVYITSPLTYVYIRGRSMYYSTDEGFTGKIDVKIEYLDSLNINNTTYYNIKIFDVYNRKSISYWAKNIGIVKLVDKEYNKIWELKTYNINHEKTFKNIHN